MQKLQVIISHKKSYNKDGIREVFNSIHPMLKVYLTEFMKNLEESVIDLENVDKICTTLRYLGTLFVDANLLEIILENIKKRQNKKK